MVYFTTAYQQGYKMRIYLLRIGGGVWVVGCVCVCVCDVLCLPANNKLGDVRKAHVNAQDIDFVQTIRCHIHTHVCISMCVVNSIAVCTYP